MTEIYALRTTANREDQVVDFIATNVKKHGLKVYAIIRPHGMRSYVFLEAETKSDAQESFQGVPYAKSLLEAPINYQEIEPMLEQTKAQVNIEKRDIVEIISGPFKRETAKVTRIDEQKDEVIVELLEAAVPIPITVKIDSVKVIRRDTDDEELEE
ncbi:MAG: transcription elongation factor Spt5 [Nanoarchaeota archaeon]|jgi:transcriptional antiterminator NusG|nr:transcription elongation factor Spt5 [Nanoarchaeota archaeon]|tara:strand:+ start:9022 stop:9489 length:468 start_codon:yes stop_codon:yes gene_type:complete